MNRKSTVAVGFAYAALSAALWPWPLLGLLHAESSAVVAGVGFFVSGLAALAAFRCGAALRPVMTRLILLLLVPLALLTLSLLWRANCGYLQGLGLFALFTVPSVILAVALAWALAATGWRRPGSAFVLVGLGIATLPVAWDLGLHPQFYTYNHVWGGVLGPIYDEELAIRSGLFWHKALTLLWALALVLLAEWMRGTRRGWGWTLVGLAVIGMYAAGPVLGFNTKESTIRAALGSHRATEHFDIYYDGDALSPGEMDVIADVTAYRYDQMAAALGLGVSERIALYLYPDARTKAALTGAAQTSVAPVWLPTPQTHLLTSRFDGSFAHELAHVFSREFGGILNASPAVGLVEGLAVALEPPDGLPDPSDQVAAASRTLATREVYDASLAEAVASRLAPLGFWTGRGAVSYTTMGSFVRYLLDRYGAEPLRTAYASGDFQTAYGLPVDSLAAGWEREVLARPPDAEAEALVALRFTRPSLFEAACPHWVAPWQRALRAGYEALNDGDSEAAVARFDEALRMRPDHPAVLAAWGRLALANGMTHDVIERLEAIPDTARSAVVWSRLRDAYALAGDAVRADTALARALDRYSVYQRDTRATVRLKAALNPTALRTFLGAAPPADRAAALEASPDPAAHVLAAALWAEAGAFDHALAAVEEGENAMLPEVESVRLGWAARFAHAAGDRSGAAAYAERAAAAYEARGAPAVAAQQRDYAVLLRSFLPADGPVLNSSAVRQESER